MEVEMGYWLWKALYLVILLEQKNLKYKVCGTDLKISVSDLSSDLFFNSWISPWPDPVAALVRIVDMHSKRHNFLLSMHV